jgi:glutathione S-transferase
VETLEKQSKRGLREMMKLLGSDNSPYVRKVRMVFEEKSIPYEYVLASPSNPASGVADANPLSKIPTLILDNGKGLYDSSVIVEYLDGVSPAPRLIPDGFAERIEVKRWEALGDGIADATVEVAHDRRRPEAQRVGDEKQLKKIAAGLKAMASDLGTRAFCHGEAYTLADIVCGVALGYIDRVLPELQWRNTYPELKRHAERLAARPSFIKTQPSPP